MFVAVETRRKGLHYKSMVSAVLINYLLFSQNHHIILYIYSGFSMKKSISDLIQPISSSDAGLRSKAPSSCSDGLLNCLEEQHNSIQASQRNWRRNHCGLMECTQSTGTQSTGCTIHQRPTTTDEGSPAAIERASSLHTERASSLHTERASSLHTERASSLHMLPTFKSGDERKARPTELHPVGGTLGNKVQDGGEGDGSLPCTPELQPDGDTDSQAGDEALVSDTKLMMMTFLRDYVGKPKARRKQDKVQETMRRVVDGVLEKHQYAYNGR